MAYRSLRWGQSDATSSSSSAPRDSSQPQLWDVCEDQEAVDMLCSGDVIDAQEASQKLLDAALERFSCDNLSIVVVKL